MRGRLRYAATAAPLRLRKRRAGCLWPSMAASVAASRKHVHARHPCLAMVRTLLRRVRSFLPSKRTDAGATVRLPLRLHELPPSPCRACSSRAASCSARALTGLWRAVRHNADYPQCRRWPRANAAHVHATSRGPSPALFARVQIVLHDRIAIRARRIIDVMSTGRAHPALADERRSCGAWAGCPCMLRGRPWPRCVLQHSAGART